MNKELILIGLGRMGAALGAHLVESGYTIHGFDISESARSAADALGINTHKTIAAAVHEMNAGHRAIWLMIPSAHVDEVITTLAETLAKGDTLIDGGNSFFKDTVRRSSELSDFGVAYIDCGTSGGVEGARTGASLMIGGSVEDFEKFEPLFATLATKNGYGHVGEVGSGHFVKMVHNGIEYGMMGAIAEGINVLHDHKEGLNINILEALKPFEHGSIIESSLISWLVDSYKVEGYLEHIAGKVPVGETEMEMEYLIENENVHVLQAAVQQRKLTRTTPSFIGTLISAMRNQFGGHKTNKTTSETSNHAYKHN